MRVWHYVVWDPEVQISTKPLQAFELRGRFYGAMPRPFFPDLGLGLAVWKGSFEGVEAEWLRWCDADGKLLATGEERADRERERADRLAAKLRELGIDPDAL